MGQDDCVRLAVYGDRQWRRASVASEERDRPVRFANSKRQAMEDLIADQSRVWRAAEHLSAGVVVGRQIERQIRVRSHGAMPSVR